jgi:dihydroorotase
MLPLCLRLSQSASLDLSSVINKITSAPAHILGIKAGSLSIGAIADICIFDESEDWRLSEKSVNSSGKNTPFLGWNFQGRVKHTVVNGRLLFSD